MNTRRIKALQNNAIVDKMVVYDATGKQVDCRTIHTDEEGREYYYPTNPNYRLGLFTDRPKDAIDCIKNGYGDGLQRSSLLGFTFERVVRYLDRQYGEDLRAKTLEGFKDTKFAYAVKFAYLNSMSGGRTICKDEGLYGYGNKPEDIQTFDTEADAQKFIDEINARASKYHEEYENLPKTGDADYDYNQIAKPFFEKIEAEMQTGNESIYWRVFSALNDEKNEGKKMYSLDIIQVIVQ